MSTDLDGFINKIGVVNRSFAELSNAFNAGASGKSGIGGFFSGLSSMRNSMSNVITEKDIANMNAYNAQIDAGVTAQTAWYRTMMDSSKAAQNMVAAANGAKVSTEGLTVATNTSRLAMIGAQVAATALNMALTMGLSIALQAIVSGISKWINAEKEARENALKTGDAAKEEAEELLSLYNAYEEANRAYQDNSGSKDNLESSTENLLRALGVEESEIERLVEQYGNLDTAINNLTVDAIGQELAKITSAYQASIETLIDTTKDGWFTSFSLLNFKIKDLDDSWFKTTPDSRFADRLKNAGMIDAGSYGTAGGSLYLGDNASIEGVMEMYQKLLDMREELNKGVEAGEYTREELAADDLYNSIQAKIDSFEKEYEGVLDYINQINALATQLQYIDYVNTNGIPESVQDFEALKESILATAQTSGQFVGSNEQIQNSVINTLATIPELSGFFTDYASAIDGAATSAAEAKISFSELLDDEDFTEVVNTYVEDTEKLKTALEDLANGDLEASDLVELFQEFPELAGNADDLDGAIRNLLNTMRGDIVSQFNSQFGHLETDDDVRALENMMDAVLEAGQVIGNTDILIDVESESAGMEDFFKAVEESVSATGLSTESIENLTNRYEGLAEFNPAELFERTTNGIHLNVQAVRELEAAYESQKKQDIKDELESLVDEYNEVTEAINETNDVSLYARRDELREQIEDVAQLAAQYDGLTSSFNKWNEAMSTPDEDDMYMSLSNGLEDIKELFDSGRIGVDDFRASVQMMTDMDLSTASVEDLLSYYDAGYATMQRFFTGNSDGLLTFLNDAKSVSDELGKTWVQLDEDGNWKIDFGVGGDEEFAKAITEMTDLQMSTQEVQILLRALAAYGFDVNLDSAYSSFDLLQTKAEEANDKLIELGKTDIKFNFNADVDSIDDEIAKAQELMDSFKNTDGSVNLNVEGAQECQDILIGLITRKQMLNAPTVMSVDTSGAEANISNCIGLLQDFETNYNDLEIETAVGVDTTTAQTNIQNVLTQLSQLDSDTQATLGLDDTEFQTALATLTAQTVDVSAGLNLDPAALTTVQTAIAGISPEMLVTLGIDSTAIDGYVPPDDEATVTYNVDDSQVRRWSAPLKTGTARYTAYLNSWTPPTKYGTVYYTAVMRGTSRANGTAYVQGTAFKRGSWGAKDSGDALGGELGQELIVRDGKFFTIGDNGAEFFKYKKGDIIFNAEQTKQILENGKLSYGNTRGRALANGTIEGRAFSNAGGSFHIGGTVVTVPTGGGGSGGSRSGGGSSSSDADEFLEVFDWIEVAIDRIERSINRLDLKAQSIYKSWTTRNNNLREEMSEVTNEIALQEQAYNRYIQEANSVGLSASWAAVVRSGAIDISKITDEDLAEKIKEYQEWYEKCPSIW